MARHHYEEHNNASEDDWTTEPMQDAASEGEVNQIYTSGGINPSKRRRIEMLQEERVLRKSLREVFDED